MPDPNNINPADAEEPGDGAPQGVDEPQWARYRYRDEKVKRERAIEAQRIAEARAAALEQELGNFRGRLAKLEGPAEPKTTPPEERLANLRNLHQRIAEFDTIVATSDNPEEVAAAKTELRKVRPEHRVQLVEELAALKAEQARSSVLGELSRRDSAQQGARALQVSLAQKFGDDVLNLNSPLMKLAAEKLKVIAVEHGGDDSNGALSRLAILEAKIEMDNREGRGSLSDKDRRLLAVEGDARRAAGPMNEIAALNSKGDWKSRAEAADKRIDEAFKKLGWM